MVQLCPRCQRANPEAAVYCHFDGCVLRQGAPGAAAVGQLLQEFIFPSGRRCRTFDDLVQGCYAEWEDAGVLLHDGTFARFLAGVGRADLAKAAREAQGQADRDMALTDFVSALPARQVVQGPKLGLNPRRMVLGPVRVGEQRPGRVVIVNEGRGLLQGKVTVGAGQEWLKIVEGADDHTAHLKTGKEQPVAIRAETAGLIVGQRYSGKLVVVTNGGVAELPIRLDLVARSFARAPYQGASDPRDLARKMRDNPHPAVALLESGEIARWFASNGWAYPIVGACAPGLAAVQQYFEELGLAKAPQIVVSDQELRFQCTAPETVAGQVAIRSPARKLVYGRAESDSPWLKVTTPGVSGQGQAQIGFAIDTTLMDEDRVYLGALKVIANAGQSFTVRIQADVQGNRKGWFGSPRSVAAPPAPPPVFAPPPPNLPPLPPPPPPAPAWVAAAATQTLAPPATAKMTAPVLTPIGHFTTAPKPVSPPDVVSAGPRVGLLQALLIGAILGLLGRLVLVFPADLYARLLANPVTTPAPGSLQTWLHAPPADGAFVRLFVLATWWVGALAGVVLVWKRGGNWADLICGLIAGAVSGLAGSATVACALVLGDALPRVLLYALFGSRTVPPAVATPLWIIAASLCWLGEGAAIGVVLAVLGRRGAAVLALLGSPLAELLRLCGMRNMADFFALRGN